MKGLFHFLWTPLCPVFMFLLFQMAGMLLVYIDCSLELTLVLTDVLIIVWALWRKKVTGWDFHKDISWSNGRWLEAFAGALVLIYVFNIVSEWLDLPDIIMDEVMMLARRPLGILAIALLGPMAEEVCFRGAIIGGMLRDGRHPWSAIVVSAVLFGLIHLNPAQIPFATAMGVVFGMLYVRTGSLLLPMLVHIVNNTASVVTINVMGDEARDMKLTELMGSPVAEIVATLLFLIGTCALWHFVKPDKQRLRAEMRWLKGKYTREQLQALSLPIEQAVMETLEWRISRTVLLYHALADEVDTSALLAQAQKDGKRILLPRVQGENLTLHPYVEGAMQRGAYGIMEPDSEEFAPEKYDEIELVIVPGMAFDRRGHRLGRGRGYYDRLLPGLRKAHLMGMGFPFQIVAAVPYEKHDVAVVPVIRR